MSAPAGKLPPPTLRVAKPKTSSPSLSPAKTPAVRACLGTARTPWASSSSLHLPPLASSTNVLRPYSTTGTRHPQSVLLGVHQLFVASPVLFHSGSKPI